MLIGPDTSSQKKTILDCLTVNMKTLRSFETSGIKHPTTKRHVRTWIFSTLAARKSDFAKSENHGWNTRFYGSSALFMDVRLYGAPWWRLFWLPHWKQWPRRRASSLQSLATNYVAMYRAVGTATDPMWMGGWRDLDHCPRSKSLLGQHLRHVFAPTRG